MKRLHEGLDYKLYKIYIWGGLPAVVTLIVVSGLLSERIGLPGPQISGGGFGDDLLRDAQPGSQLTELGLVQVADRVQGAGRIAVDG